MGRILSAYLTPHPPIIIAQIGQGEEQKAIKTIEGMEEIGRDIAMRKPQTILIITPHGPVFSDANAISMEKTIKGDFSSFGHNELSYSYDTDQELTCQIVKNCLKNNISIAQMTKEMYKRYKLDGKLDHGALVPLHFVDKYYSDFQIVHITYGVLSPKELYLFGRQIEASILQQKNNVVIIASGDLSHKLKDSGPYSYSPEGPEFDRLIIEIIEKADIGAISSFDMELAHKAGECGLRSLMILAGILSPYELDTKVLSYEGPYGVGYGTAKLIPGKRTNRDLMDTIEKSQKTKQTAIRQSESPHAALARKSLEHYVLTGEYLEVPEDLPEELLVAARPVFVSIKKHGSLRGCIGSTAASRGSLAREIIHYAVEAGTRDPRFSAVTEDELEELVYSVDVLSPSEPIHSIAELDPGIYGVIVEKGYRRGLLLPMIEGVDTPRDQVRIALQKAGISEDDDYKMERFRVERYQ